MDIYLYKNLSDENRMNKTLSAPIKLVGEPRETMNVETPVVNIPTTVNLSGYNYARIPYYNRYYFISNIEEIRAGHLWRLSLLSDPLTSRKAEILSLPAIINKTANAYLGSPYVDDNSAVISVQRAEQTLALSGGFSETPYYILACAGVVV